MRFEVPRSQVHDGESWAEAADRVAPEHQTGPVLAVDLSGDPLVFGIDDDHRFSARPMTRGDMPNLLRWVQTPHVAPWWTENTPEEVEEHYGPALDGRDPTRLWIWEVNGRSVGFAQDYRVADHPDWLLLCKRPDAVGFDYVVGEPAFVGRGLGTSLLWVFLRDIVWPAYADAPELYAAPDHRNLVSRRVLAKLGFTEGVWFDEPRADGGTDTVVGCSLDVAQVIGRAPST